jgi:SAM-dependent methyltransferase
MSHFSNVDASGVAQSLAAYLTKTDHSMSPFKAYVAAAARAAVGEGLVVDLGCGLGRDLARLAAAGVRPIGVDTSASFLVAARAVGTPLVQADGASLPFRGRTVDGVRIERTLEHVAVPERVLDEVARVLRPGGWVAVLEPDFSTFRVESDLVPHGTWPAALLTVRHPNVGGELAALLTARGFRIRDVVTESSRGYELDNLPVDATAVVARAVAERRCDRWLAQSWIDEQKARTVQGTFRARWDKVLVVASMGE